MLTYLLGYIIFNDKVKLRNEVLSTLTLNCKDWLLYILFEMITIAKLKLYFSAVRRIKKTGAASENNRIRKFYIGFCSNFTRKLFRFNSLFSSLFRWFKSNSTASYTIIMVVIIWLISNVKCGRNIEFQFGEVVKSLIKINFRKMETWEKCWLYAKVWAIYWYKI